MLASPMSLIFATSLTRHDQSGLEPQKAFQPMLCTLIKTYCLLSNGPHFVHIEVFNHDGNLLTQVQTQLQCKASVTEPSNPENTGMAGHQHEPINVQDIETSFTVFHQNIMGLLKKSEELISSLSPHFPQVLCLT